MRQAPILCTLLVVFSAGALQACAHERSHHSVRLPPGDAVEGQQVFVDLRCHACHEIEGFDPAAAIVAATRIRLGGPTQRVRTYEDLVTSIANPSHRIASGYPPDAVTVNGVPLMSLIRLNEVMTVQNLVDVAAFLQSRYDVAPPPTETEDVYPSDAEVFRFDGTSSPL